MSEVKNYRELGCQACLNGTALGFDFSMAFQPILDLSTRTVFAQEALVRGIGNLPAATVFKQVNDENRYAFDQACRVKAVSLAARLKMPSLLSINFMPNAVYRPELCIRTTLKAAEDFGFPISRIMFEVTESERVDDIPHLQSIIRHYQQQGFTTALDDFGAGFSGLNMLADLHVDILKLDMHLVRDIDKNGRKHAIVRGVMATSEELGIKVIAEGVETPQEYVALREMGINLFQGFLFARPAYEALAEIDWQNR
ncbi:EAL domain-containing protein [Gallaecimonas kandeliae]|uniref:EAL domain-containing protein n=1 Tax=Gallaecimonas kandeliae TaxID=3029055 RepID=UPI0026473152|nr:EAL domain-containing protein [Gallaecimonas kandeliae]WKE64860.1 EAL domain-containing protein [Gallaecimonas kandeliae]